MSSGGPVALNDLHVLGHEALPCRGLGDVGAAEVVLADVVGVQHLQREVDPVAFEVLVHVAQDVDQLHLDAQINGVQASSPVFVPVDFNQNQTDR